MGGGGSPKVVEPEPVKQQKIVTPAVAKTIQADTANAVAQQNAARANLSGIRRAYNRFDGDNGGSGNMTLGGR